MDNLLSHTGTRDTRSSAKVFGLSVEPRNWWLHLWPQTAIKHLKGKEENKRKAFCSQLHASMTHLDSWHLSQSESSACFKKCGREDSPGMKSYHLTWPENGNSGVQNYRSYTSLPYQSGSEQTCSQKTKMPWHYMCSASQVNELTVLQPTCKVNHQTGNLQWV